MYSILYFEGISTHHASSAVFLSNPFDIISLLDPTKQILSEVLYRF